MSLLMYKQQIDENSTYLLPIDIKINDEGYIIIADLPGFTKEQLNVEAAYDSLVISAEREISKLEDGQKLICNERRGRKFRRSLSFRRPINPKSAEIKFENGVLEINLPFAEEAKPVKLIPKIN